jgi:hypothetical protein
VTVALRWEAGRGCAGGSEAETATATIAVRANMDILLGLSTHMRAGEPDGPDAD